jgi:hypothetical protein
MRTVRSALSVVTRDNAPSQSFIVASFPLLETFDDLSHRSFLLGRRMRLLQGQICKPELSLRDGELVVCCGPYSQRLTVHLTGPGEGGSPPCKWCTKAML